MQAMKHSWWTDTGGHDMADKVQEEFDHDDCPKCGTPSVPGENVSDQALRYCPKCHHDWFEDFNRATKKGKWEDDLTPDEQKTCY